MKTYYVYCQDELVDRFDAKPDSDEYHDNIRRISKLVGYLQLDLFILEDDPATFEMKLEWKSTTCITHIN
jgi:hypothetical protein